MKITKYAQSCILLETKGKRILIDPGYLLFEGSFLEKNWINIDILLVTHKHRDHIDLEISKEILKNNKTKFFTSNEVANTYPELKNRINIIKEGDLINLNDVKIEVAKAFHGYIPSLKGREINENIGFIIDDGNKRFYFTSDTISFKNEYKCDIIAIPVSNHGLTTGPYDAADFAKETGAKSAIPVHYDNPSHPADLEECKKEFNKVGINCYILNIKQTIEL